MSRSNNEEIKNPALRFYEWLGDRGVFRYFDKELTDDNNPKGTNVDVKLPFKFVVLDVLSGVCGFSDADNCGIYSNEIKDLKKQALTVKTFKGTEIATGFYADIKDACIAKGGQYSSNVYIGFYEKGVLVIGHIKMRGASLGAWIDYGKKTPFYKGAIAVNSFTEGRKGKTVYKIPVFTYSEISPETEGAAKFLDMDLQEYLKKYFAKNNQTLVETENTKAVESDMPSINDAPPIEVPDEGYIHTPGKISPNRKVEEEVVFEPNPNQEEPIDDGLPF